MGTDIITALLSCPPQGLAAFESTLFGLVSWHPVEAPKTAHDATSPKEIRQVRDKVKD